MSVPHLQPVPDPALTFRDRVFEELAIAMGHAERNERGDVVVTRIDCTVQDLVDVSDVRDNLCGLVEQLIDDVSHNPVGQVDIVPLSVLHAMLHAKGHTS